MNLCPHGKMSVGGFCSWADLDTWVFTSTSPRDVLEDLHHALVMLHGKVSDMNY